MTLFRKLVAFLSLAAVFVAALTPASSTLFWAAIVVPLLLFFGIVAVASAERQAEDSAAADFLCFRDIPSRAPPTAALLS
jgi:hypothetical protein